MDPLGPVEWGWALLPGTAALGCPSGAGQGATCPNQPWHSQLHRTAPSPSGGVAAPAPLTSRPSLDVCPFLSTSTPLESQPFCCAYASLPKSGVPSPTSLSEGKLLPPPTSQCSSPLHGAPRLSLRPRFSPVLAGLVAIAFVGHGQRMKSQHLGLPLAWPLAPQVRGQTQLPLHTPGPSSYSFCCPLSSAESAREDRAPCGLTPALAAAQPDGKRHIDARCSLRL